MSDPIHRRINWPEGQNMEAVALGIYTCQSHYLDAALLPTIKVSYLYKDRLLKMWNDNKDINDDRVRIAAMWYAVMKTAIETYGMKPVIIEDEAEKLSGEFFELVESACEARKRSAEHFIEGVSNLREFLENPGTFTKRVIRETQETLDRLEGEE